jgi:class 3 adenylate cyclase/predicted ATPase
VTTLFADIKGSMELIEDLDPEEARAIVDPALKLMMEAVQRYGGYVAQSTGDGIFALFGAPVAYEDHPQRALYAALRMQEELKRYSDRIHAESRLPIQARVGVNTGEVVVRSIPTGEGRTEYLPVGHSTGIAARMQALAPVGSTAATEPIRKLCEGYFVFKSLGPTRVKGVSEPVNVYEVTGLGPLRTRLQRGAARGYTKFVGRQREMETLKDAAGLAQAGHGQLVAAVAEPGVGKSRVFLEFKAKNQSGWMVLEALSVSYGKASTYLPVLDLLHSYFKIASDDDARSRREKVAQKIAVLDRSLEDTLPYLFALLGIVEGEDPLGQMDAQVKKRRTLDAIKRILLRESLNQPLLVMFEDLHWIDEQTQEFLNLLADSIANAKIMLLVNYRPEYSHQWGSKTYYTQLRLDPLVGDSAEEVLSVLLGDQRELTALKRTIIERTEGNPFFMEETVQVLLEEGALVREGTMRLTKPLGELRIPLTVQGILAARIDRLPADTKDLLQSLSVIGREPSLSLIRAVVPKSAQELEDRLRDLQLREFIYEQPEVGDAEYVFKHALTQEVAYNAILNDRRRMLHERIGDAIESLYASSIEDRLNELAYHYGHSSNVPKALEYFERAGARAVERSAYLAAVSQLSAALELLRATPSSPRRAERELALLLALGSPTCLTKGWNSPEAEAVYLRARELCREMGETPQLFPTIFGLASYYWVAGQLRPARELMEQNLNLARRAADSNLLLQAHHGLGYLQTWAGDLVSARASQEQLLALYDSKTHHPLARLFGGDDPAICCLGMKSLALWLLGYPDQGLQAARTAIDMAQQMSDAVSHALATVNISFLHAFRREPASVIEQARKSIAMSEEFGFQTFLQWARLNERAFTPDRCTAEGIRRIRQCLPSSTYIGLSLFLAWLAEACLDGGDPDEARSAIEEAFAFVERSGEHMWEAELLRLRGSMRSKDAVAAEADFHRAIVVARSQQARSLELRATTSLARLLRDTGRRDEARTMLAEIYDSFTEGFDTADLKDAKVLLDELTDQNR